MSFGIIEEATWLVYQEDPSDPPYEVHGHRVGRFGIRTMFDVEEPDWRNRPWRVDHMGTGIRISPAADFPEALSIADDLSRFSRKDPSARGRGEEASRQRLKKQLGPALMGWIADTYEDGHQFTFREWLEERGTPWSPRGRKWRR